MEFKAPVEKDARVRLLGLVGCLDSGSGRLRRLLEWAQNFHCVCLWAVDRARGEASEPQRPTGSSIPPPLMATATASRLAVLAPRPLPPASGRRRHAPTPGCGPSRPRGLYAAPRGRVPCLAAPAPAAASTTDAGQDRLQKVAASTSLLISEAATAFLFYLQSCFVYVCTHW